MTDKKMQQEDRDSALRAEPAGQRDADCAALRLVQELSRISMSLAADLVQGADYTFQGHDYLDRNAVVERVMQWRAEWDATREARTELATRCRAEGGDTSEKGGLLDDSKTAETRMNTSFEGGRLAPEIATKEA